MYCSLAVNVTLFQISGICDYLFIYLKISTRGFPSRVKREGTNGPTPLKINKLKARK